MGRQIPNSTANPACRRPVVGVCGVTADFLVDRARIHSASAGPSACHSLIVESIVRALSAGTSSRRVRQIRPENIGFGRITGSLRVVETGQETTVGAGSMARSAVKNRRALQISTRPA
jgi:hypothetical protein